MDPNNPNQDDQNQTTNPSDSVQMDPQTGITQPDAAQQDDTQTPAAITPQSDTPQATENQGDQTQTPTMEPSQQPATPTTIMQSDPNSGQPQEPAAAAPSDPATSADPTTPADPNAGQTEGTYIEDVGEDLIDLLDEISENENLLKAVADEMQLDTERVKGILTKLLTKIDQGQITEDELALIMASTVADEVLDQE